MGMPGPEAGTGGPGGVPPGPVTCRDCTEGALGREKIVFSGKAAGVNRVIGLTPVPGGCHYFGSV